MTATQPPLPRSPWAAWPRSVVFLVLFCLAGLLGRATVTTTDGLALVWPAAGVAVVWLTIQSRATMPLDVLLLAAGTFVVNVATGVPLASSVVLVTCNVFQAVVAVMLLRQWSPEVWSERSEYSVFTTTGLGRMILACGVATLSAAVLGTLGLGLLGGETSLSGVALWWGRNLCGMLAILAAVHLVRHRWSTTSSTSVLGWAVRHERRRELVLLLLATAALYGVGGYVVEGLAFPLLAVTVWAGLRFTPLVASLHSLLCGLAIVVVTLTGHGPFSRLDDPRVAALFAQLFVIMVVVTGLALAIAREERALAVSRLTVSEHEAAGRAEVLRTVLESLHEGVMVVEEPFAVLYENSASAVMRGRDRDDQPEISIHRLDGTPIPEEEQPVVLAWRGTPVHNLDILRRVGERERVLSVSATPIWSAAQPQAVLVYQDVTEDRAARAELDAFAGAVAHDLRNPLAVVEGWVEALSQQFLEAAQPGGTPVPPVEALRILGRIDGSASRMQKLIADLLAHATAGDKALDMHDLDLRTLVREVAVQREVSKHVRVGAFPTVHGDVVLLRQLLDNLLGNAVTYVAPGVTPAITVSGEARGDRVAVRIADNGIGIPAEEAERVFERFHRAHADQYVGTGLGLAICRRIVERHGGRITARSGPDGVGSVFEFTLPVSPDEATAPPPSPSTLAPRATEPPPALAVDEA